MSFFGTPDNKVFVVYENTFKPFDIIADKAITVIRGNNTYYFDSENRIIGYAAMSQTIEQPFASANRAITKKDKLKASVNVLEKNVEKQQANLLDLQ